MLKCLLQQIGSVTSIAAKQILYNTFTGLNEIVNSQKCIKDLIRKEKVLQN